MYKLPSRQSKLPALIWPIAAIALLLCNNHIRHWVFDMLRAVFHTITSWSW